MTPAFAILLVIVLCAALVLASYFHLLYSESLRIMPREAARSLPYFEDTLRPKLKLEAETGVQRFAAVKQCILLLLAFDLAYLRGRGGFTGARLLEALVLAAVLLILFAYIAPHILVTRTSGQWALRFLAVARALSMAVRPLLLVVGFGYSIADLAWNRRPRRRRPLPRKTLKR